MGFPTPSVAHHLRNTGNKDLVYLVGGENLEIEIADFPHLKKRMLRREETVEIYNFSDAKPFEPLDA
ncbi:cupin domain protein (plasmid) [Leptolyngbya sp. NIES-3755]|nr:cupin domain protein [Leptolyngbya sp. NIES-3755]